MTDPKRIMTALKKSFGPTKTWPSNCYALACAAVKAGVPGKALYGHWLGPVAEGTVFSKRPIVRHGWVLMPDGRVCDPTRFVFEGKKAYVYVGANDYYDMGGNAFRRATMRPPPAWDAEDKQYKCTVPTPAWNFLEKALKLDEVYDNSAYKVGYVSQDQLFWLANLDLDTLGPHAKPIFEWMVKIGREAAIPIDNMRHVLG